MGWRQKGREGAVVRERALGSSLNLEESAKKMCPEAEEDYTKPPDSPGMRHVGNHLLCSLVGFKRSYKVPLGGSREPDCLSILCRVPSGGEESWGKGKVPASQEGRRVWGAPSWSFT